VAVIYALYRVGVSDYVSQLAVMLRDDPEREVRANAAMVMGRMGEPTAKEPLEAMLTDEQDPSVQLQMCEALARLGDDRSARRLEAYAKATFLDERLVAIPALVEANTPQAEFILRELLSARQPPRVRVAAAGALARMGRAEDAVWDLCRQAAEDPRGTLRKAYGPRRKVGEIEASSFQRLAVIGLGWAGRHQAAGVLHGLLGSPDGPVRAAAAMGLLRVLEAFDSPQPAVETQTPEAAGRPATAASRPRLHTAGGKD